MWLDLEWENIKKFEGCMLDEKLKKIPEVDSSNYLLLFPRNGLY